MLRVFIRHLGESLIIGDEIEVTVLAIKGDEVRFGIEAPESVSVQPKPANARPGSSRRKG